MSNIHKQLGELLRLKREALRPRDVGLSEMGRRRTPGLRRGEVAELAGISTDWYMRLEQGRDSLPSKLTAESLAKVLRLSGSERAHLMNMVLGQNQRPFKKATVPSDIRLLVESLPTAAYLIDPRMDLLIWNQAAVDLFQDYSRLPPGDRNMLALMFLGESSRDRFPNWELEAREMLESFRASFDLWSHIEEFDSLVQRLLANSPQFRRWWKAHGIKLKAAGQKELKHKRHGSIVVRFTTFQLTENSDLRLVLYGPIEKQGLKRRPAGR